MIKFINVTKIYPPDIKALNQVNLHIKPGEFVSIVGQSGSGKTTLVKSLIGEEKVSKGKIIVGGWDITDIGQREVPFLRRQIGVIFQDFKLLDKKTLFENTAFALQVCGQTPKKIKAIVPQVLKIVGLEGKTRRYPREVSGGEQQRAAIARAIVNNPSVIFADEPTGNLDSKSGAQVMDILQRLHKEGNTIILVTHETYTAEFADRLIHIKDGLVDFDRPTVKQRRTKEEFFK